MTAITIFIIIIWILFHPISLRTVKNCEKEDESEINDKANITYSYPYKDDNPCSWAIILEERERHWNYGNDEVNYSTSNNTENTVERCPSNVLPIRQWFGFNIDGVESEIIIGHIKANHCGTIYPMTLSHDSSMLFQYNLIYCNESEDSKREIWNKETNSEFFHTRSLYKLLHNYDMAKSLKIIQDREIVKHLTALEEQKKRRYHEKNLLKGKQVEKEQKSKTISDGKYSVTTTAKTSTMSKTAETIKFITSQKSNISDIKNNLTNEKRIGIKMSRQHDESVRLKQNFGIAQLCIQHNLLGKSSCVSKFSVPVIIKKCDNGRSIYWLESFISRCHAAVCLKKSNEIVSPDIMLNVPTILKKHPDFFQSLEILSKKNYKKISTIEYKLEEADNLDFQLLYKRLRLKIYEKHSQMWEFARKKTYTVRSDLPITSLSSFNFYITDNVIKSSLHNLDQDADRKEKATRKKENYYTNGDYNNKNAGVAKDETLGGIREEENKETDSNYDDEEIETYGEETLGHERLNQIKFIDFEPEVLNRVFRVSVLINDSDTDYLDEVFSEMNKTSKFHLKNLTFLRTYRGLPKDISQYRLGSYVWQVIEEIWVLIVLSIVLIFVIFTIMILNRFCKVRKKQKLKYIVNRSAQTDPVLTNYIFGASTPYVVSKQMNYIGINNSAGSGDDNEASMLNDDENDDDECFVNI